MPEGPRRRIGVGVDARRLWSGGVASAVVAGLVALVGVLVSRWLANVPVLAPRRDGAYGDVHTTGLVLATAAAALAATGLVHLLMVSTPRPFLYFGWIVALVTTLVVVFPFSTTAPLDAKIATAIVDLAIGIAIGSLVGGAASRSITRSTLGPGDSEPYDEPRPFDEPRPYSETRPYDQPRSYGQARQPHDRARPPQDQAWPHRDQTQPYDRPPYDRPQPRDPGRPGTGYP
jgi:hypothetical protein